MLAYDRLRKRKTNNTNYILILHNKYFFFSIYNNLSYICYSNYICFNSIKFKIFYFLKHSNMK